MPLDHCRVTEIFCLTWLMVISVCIYVKKNKSQREDIPMHTHKHAYTLVQSSKYMKAAVISYMAKKGSGLKIKD